MGAQGYAVSAPTRPCSSIQDSRTLATFLTERGKIIPARITGTCARHQRRLTTAIKQARTVALLPYTSVYP